MDNQEDIPYFGAPPEEYYSQTPPRRSAPQPIQPAPKRKRSILRPIIYSIIIMALVFILLSPPVLNTILNNFPGYQRTFPETATFTVERRIVLSGTADYTLDIPKAFDISPAQRVVNTEYSPYPSEEQNKYGGTWDIWRGNLGGFNSHDTITIKRTIETKTMIWEMKESGTVSDIPSSLSQYTGDEWVLHPDDTPLNTDDRDGDGRTDIMINPSAPEINNLAHQLADDKPDVYSKAKAIYDYMVENFKYSTPQQMNYVQQQYGGLPKHALATLRDKWGDCDEQSMLYMSFLRALGIPARLELGALYDSQKNEWGGHAWASIYIPLPSGSTGYWYDVDIVNSEFLIRDANRFTTWIDDGNGSHLNDYYHPVTYSAGTLTVSDDYVSISYTSSGTVSAKSENSVPGFEFSVMVIAIAVPLIFLRKRKK